MEPKELRQLAEEISKVLESEERPLARHSNQLARLIAHLESEQRTMQMHSKLLETHSQALFGNPEDMEKQPGVIHEMLGIKKVLKTNQKVHLFVASCVATLVIKTIWQIALLGIKALP